MPTPAQNEFAVPQDFTAARLATAASLCLRFPAVLARPTGDGPFPDWFAHAPLLFWLVAAIRPRRIVCLGGAQDNARSVFRQALQLLDSPGEAATICSWAFADDANGGALALDQPGVDPPQTSRIQPCDLSQALRHVAAASVDILTVDGRAAPGRLQEYLKPWLEKLSPTAVVMALGSLDGNEAPRPQLAPWFPALSFPHGQGMTLFCTAAPLAGAISELFVAAQDTGTAGALAELFARLGSYAHLPCAPACPQPPSRLSEAAAKGSGFIYAKKCSEPLPGGVEHALPDIVPPPPAPFHPVPTAFSDCTAAAPGGRPLLFLSHVLPYPPRAGNEYRMDRLLTWLQDAGYAPVLLVSSFAGCQCCTPKLQATIDRYPNVIVHMANGDLCYKTALPSLNEALAALNGRTPGDFVGAIGEPCAPEERARRLLGIERSFCSDAFIEVLLATRAGCDPVAVLASYIFMSRCLPLFGEQVFTIIDTHDVFSTKLEKVVHYGIQNDIPLTREEEAAMLARADLAVAIQSEEEQELQAICPGLATVTAGVDFDFPDVIAPLAGQPDIVYIGSGNPLNCKGLHDFQRFAWPCIKRHAPKARLHVVGAVGAAIYLDDPAIIIHGAVADLAPVYALARVLINPSIAGTGLKIKTLEALVHGRPIVLWPTGVDGLDAFSRRLCHVAGDWFDFAIKVVGLLAEEATDAQDNNLRVLRGKLDRKTVYAALGEALRQGICRKRGQESA